MEPTVSELKKQAELQVANHSIYVWGGSGQLCKDVNETWIRNKESRCDGGKHADDAVSAWKQVMSSPYKNVARCFDCSGYVSYCLIQIGALKSRTNCDGLFAKCDTVGTPRDGTLLFRVNPNNPNDETHVGMYFDGYQYHAKGRKDKVVKEKYKKSYWHIMGWFRAVKEDEPSPEPEPYIFTRLLKYGCTGEDVIELKKLLIAHGFDKGITVDTAASKRFGLNTKRRVKDYQRSVNLKPDGIAGHDTIISLGGVWLGD